MFVTAHAQESNGSLQENAGPQQSGIAKVYNRKIRFFNCMSSNKADEHALHSILELSNLVNSLLILSYFNYDDISVFIDYFRNKELL